MERKVAVKTSSRTWCRSHYPLCLPLVPLLSLDSADVHFDKIPPLTFIANQDRCGWGDLLQGNVLGPFAPRLGLIGEQREERKASERRPQRVTLETVKSPLLEKAMQRSQLAKTIKKQQTAVQQLERVEAAKKERELFEQAKQQQTLKRLTNGQLCEIGIGSQVTSIPQSLRRCVHAGPQNCLSTCHRCWISCKISSPVHAAGPVDAAPAIGKEDSK